MSLNTVAQCDARLLQMELEWKINRSGPFPDKIRNTIANIHAALVIREAEASQKIPTPTTTSTPTTTPTTATPAHTKPAALLALTEDDLNTVEKIDTQLARMELQCLQPPLRQPRFNGKKFFTIIENFLSGGNPPKERD
jgi:hypothetical protein